MEIGGEVAGVAVGGVVKDVADDLDVAEEPSAGAEEVEGRNVDGVVVVCRLEVK